MADNRGSFDKMSEKKHKDIASEGGKASTGSFGDKNAADASKMGKKGAKAQPIAAKRKGGENSHQNS